MNLNLPISNIIFLIITFAFLIFLIFDSIKQTTRISSQVSATVGGLLNLLIAIGGLLITIPLTPIISLLIRIDSPGLVFYKTSYCGAYGKKFRAYKFRTMVKNADNIIKQRQHPFYVKHEHDPIVTPVGRILRKTGLDELPLLINVLKGNMNIVGPQPATPRDNNTWRLYSEKSSIKPGVFYAGYKNSYSFDLDRRITKKIINRKKLLAEDKNYIRHPSLRLATVIFIQGVWITMIRISFVFFKTRATLIE